MKRLVYILSVLLVLSIVLAACGGRRGRDHTASHRTNRS